MIECICALLIALACYIHITKVISGTTVCLPDTTKITIATLGQLDYRDVAHNLPPALRIVACSLPALFDVGLLACTCKEAFVLMKRRLQEEKPDSLLLMRKISRVIRTDLQHYLPYIMYDIFSRYDPNWFPHKMFNNVSVNVYTGNKYQFAITANVKETDSNATTVTISMHATNSTVTLVVGEPLVINLRVARPYTAHPLGEVQWKDAYFTIAHSSGRKWRTIAKHAAWTNAQPVLESRIHTTMDSLVKSCKEMRFHC